MLAGKLDGGQIRHSTWAYGTIALMIPVYP
jgi:hypothetical protein